MPQTEIEALMFDLDGVIADTIELHFQAFQRITSEHNVPFNREINEQLRGLGRRDSLEILWKNRELDEETAQQLMQRKNEYYLALMRNMTPDDVSPGVIEVIEEARARGLKVAVASSSRNARAVLEQLQLTERFDAIGDGHSVANTKPAPDVFIWVAGRLNVHPRQALVIEDGSAGIQAALKAGCQVVGVGEGQTDEAHLRLNSLADISAKELLDHFSGLRV